MGLFGVACFVVMAIIAVDYTFSTIDISHNVTGIGNIHAELLVSYIT